MSRKHFSLLLAVTLVVAVAVLLVPSRTGREAAVEKSRLLPQLQGQVNELDWLQIRGAGGDTVATLRRGEGFWKVEEASGYRADWEQIRTLLTDLTQAEIVEHKTANPEYYDRLGVEDVDQPGAGGLLMDFGTSNGIPAVIIGNRSEGRDGHYVRRRDDAESVLIDRSLEVPRDRMNWLDQNIIHVADSEVVEIEIVHPDGQRVRARKVAANDENFELQDIPEGAEIESAWTVNSLAGGLASLTLEDVAAAVDIDWAGATQFGLVTADGLRIDTELTAIDATDDADQADSEYWIRLQASLFQTAVDSAVTAPEDGGETGDRAAAVNDRVSGWAYRIPKYKYDAMTKRVDDLLKEVDESPAL
jgi:hypothetical protein